MRRNLLLRGLLVGALAVLLAVVATPAFAQNGSLRGKVVDEQGNPVAGAEVTLDFVGDYVRQFKATTDSKGEWIRAGMPSGGGTWNLTVKKGELGGHLNGIRVMIGEMTRVADITIIKGGDTAGKAPAGMSAEEIEKRNKRQAELEQLFNDANAAVDAGNFDDAVTKLNAIAAEVPNCTACYLKLGEVNKSKGDLAAAEQAYLKAIELDATKGEPYAALATIYNQQKKFDDAAKMSAKANELMGAAGGADANSVYNQGVILWNQGKAAEAQVQFEKAIQLDPSDKMAEAHYLLGMALVNQGKLADAKKPFQDYLTLAPNGPNAATAKAILDTIK